MSTRNIIGGIGAVIGFIVGGPQGAMYGWQIGSAVGSIVDPMIIKGPSITDLAQQTSQEGGPRPIVFALSPPMAGNIIASGPVRRIKRRKSQGKGGPKVEYETLHRTYAIGVSEGTITRFVRVWRNAELVYDARSEDEFNFEELRNASTQDRIKYVFRILANNLKFIEKTRFYEGTYDQNPDPALEELFEVGHTPSYRGTAYMVVEDDDLTDFRGAIPQYMFQVERCEGTYLTTPPYPIEDSAGMSAQLEARDSNLIQVTDDAMDMSFEALGGEIYGDLVAYGDGEPEAMEIESFEALGGEFFGGLVEYEDGEPEAMEIESFEALGGDFFGDVVDYEEGEPEAMDVSFESLGGTLD